MDINENYNGSNNTNIPGGSDQGNGVNYGCVNMQGAQQPQGGQYTPNMQNMQAGYRHDYTYYPEAQQPQAKPKKKHKALKRVAAVFAVIICAAAVGAGSIYGYTLINNKNSGGMDKSVSANISKDDSSEQDAPAEETDNDRPVRDVPSLEQLAALDNALPIPQIVDKVSPSVVGVSSLLRNGTSYGTGFVISEDGYIVTNYHVIDGAQKISVAFSVSDDDEEYDAELIGGDEQTDIAVLKIDKTGLTAVEFGKSSDLIVGELAITIGNPMGSELSGTVTAGIISALNRSLTVEERKMTLIQTDASINNGNSGGPLINSYGQVVGITSAKIASYYADGLGFAIPIDEALPIVSDLIEYGYVKGRPVIGISGEDISDIYAQYYDVPKGFYVAEVTEDGPAEKAGIKVGDIVIGIEGELVESIDEFNEIKKNYKAGDTIKVSVYRDGDIVDIEVTLAEDKSALENKDDQADQQNGQNNFEGYDPFSFFNFGY